MKLGNYVVRCKKGNVNKFGFGYRHKKGHFVQYDGRGSFDINEAFIYNDKIANHYDFSCPVNDLEDRGEYYEYLPVTICLTTS